MNSYIEELDVRKLAEHLRQAGKILMANQANSEWRDIITKEDNKTRADIIMDEHDEGHIKPIDTSYSCIF